jgi:hypothetical protein
VQVFCRQAIAGNLQAKLKADSISSILAKKTNNKIKTSQCDIDTSNMLTADLTVATAHSHHWCCPCSCSWMCGCTGQARQYNRAGVSVGDRAVVLLHD